MALPPSNHNTIRIILIALVVVFVVGVSFLAWQSRWIREPRQQGTYQPQDELYTPSAASQPQELAWQQAEDGWRAMGQVPPCPINPMMKAPADLSQATAVLYPGQTRGGNYKPHGGFRFDTAPTNNITVTAPIDGYIVRGGRYLSEGEEQYTFDVMNSCGIMYRVGHLRFLPSNLQAIADTWPKAVEGDSRTQQVYPSVFVRQGEILATSIGIIGTKNTFFDWGAYDYRQENAASKSPAYQQLHAQDKELSWHALCWFDMLPLSDAMRVRSLPAGDSASGTTSDYCK